MMMMRFSCWLILLLTVSNPLFAEWRLGVKHHLDARFNTRVLLDYVASTDRQKEVVAEISFWEENTHRVLVSREVRLAIQGSQLFEEFFQLPAGKNYHVDVDIYDRELEERFLLSLARPYLVRSRGGVRTSGIYLSYQSNPDTAFAKPLLDQRLNPDRKKLYYFLEMEARGYEVLTFRAELYEKKPDADQEAVSFLVSINQTRRVEYLRNDGRIYFIDSLDISGLPSGQYQIDLRIYNDDQRIAARKDEFSIGSDLSIWIFQNIEEAFQMMVYVVPPTRIDSILETERDTFVRKEIFFQFWNDLYEDAAGEQMERYYRKVFQAKDDYGEIGPGGEEMPGWETDRGRVFILYGPPQEESIVNIKQKNYLRWTYSRWSLSFLFEERNQRYILVE
jgi:GWxTD domain-containing protein